ncbi:MAG: hypothetical protein F4Y49_02235 [Dehalococcoidia bacterium]|nr:hypothetical protein [Dehalococcoidia bacterium]MYA62148.1 hypothetical protein [Dehalococcoidia bacterium]
MTDHTAVGTLTEQSATSPSSRLRKWSVIMVNTQIRLTYEDYVELPDDRRYEIIDGELYEMTAPTLSLIPGLEVRVSDVFAQS